MYIVYKIGMTGSPKKRLNKANKHTFGIPIEFKIEFAKKVSNYKEKEKILHKILSKTAT